MQPIGGEEQKKANGFPSGGLGLTGDYGGTNNNSSTGTPSSVKPVEGAALGGMNFNFTPFGQPTGGGGGAPLRQTPAAGGIGSTPVAGAPAKRLSIDESWVNVDWHEVSRNKNDPQPPPKSPKIEPAPPAASILHPPSVSLATPLAGPSSTASQRERERETEMTSPSGFGSGRPVKEPLSPSKSEAPTTVSTSASVPAPAPSLLSPSKSVVSEGSGAMSGAKSMTATKETGPLRTESSSTFTGPKPAASISNDGPQSGLGIQSPPKPAPATSAKVGETASVPALGAMTPPKTIPGPAKSQAATPVTAATASSAKPSIASTPAAVTSEQASKAKAKAGEAGEGEGEASTSRATPTTKTPRKSAQATPTTPRSSGRTRKTVDRLSPTITDLHHEPKTLEVPAGSGTKFGDIPHVAKELGKRKSDYQPIVTLHRVIFGRPGEAAKRKGNLRGFHGMAAGEDMAKIAEKLLHHQVDELREICGLLNLEHVGEKRSLAERIAKYLMKPADLGDSKPLPRRSTPQKRGKASPVSTRKGKKRGRMSKAGSRTAAGDKAAEQGEEEDVAESGSEGDDSVIADLEEGPEDVVAATATTL